MDFVILAVESLSLKNAKMVGNAHPTQLVDFVLLMMKKTKENLGITMWYNLLIFLI